MTDARDGGSNTGRHRGYDGMSEVLRNLTENMLSMKGSYDDNVMPMYHIHSVKRTHEGTEAGSDILAAMDDRKVWMPTAMMMYTQFGGAEWAALISDAYVRSYEGGEKPMKPLAPGALEEMRNEGDMKVMEAMIVVVQHDSQVQEQCQMRYWLDDHGNLEWDEPEWFISDGDTTGEGFVSDCLKVLMGHGIPSPSQLLDVLTEMGEGSIAVEEVMRSD